MKKQDEIYILTFKLSELKALPPEMQQYGRSIRMVYLAFQRVVRGLLDYPGLAIGLSYQKFLRENLNSWVDVYKVLNDETQTGNLRDEKENTFINAKGNIFNTILNGHIKLEDAHRSLKIGNIPKFSFHLAQAGYFFGRLALFAELTNSNSFEMIGSAKMAIAGAAKGGFNSGKARKLNSRIPTSEMLRSEQQRLIEANKPIREISAILAKKYSCTTDHIRKLLKRD